MQTKSSECLERMFCDCVEGVRLENLHRKMLKKSCELENGNDKCITALKLLRKDIRARKLVDKEPFPTYQKGFNDAIEEIILIVNDIIGEKI